MLKFLNSLPIGLTKTVQASLLTPAQASWSPNCATRSPDAAWIKLDRWNALTDAQKASFAPICPDFVIELRSASDTLSRLQAKMQESIDNGAGLGWLIDRQSQQVYVYRPHQTIATLDQPTSLSGDPELPGFVPQMAKIW